MNTNTEKGLFDHVVEFVDTAFGGKKPHFERTVFWMRKFVSDCTEAHVIAAYAHDIERAYRDDSIDHGEYSGDFYTKYHPQKGAEILTEFLRTQGAEEDLIAKVSRLVSAHEVGGDVEQNALMDADSVSFFETNAEMFVKKKAPVEGWEKIRRKFDWMFNRISMEERKHYAIEQYQKWSAELTKIK